MEKGTGHNESEIRPSLLETYLRERDDLVRVFAPKLRSREAAEDLVQELGRRLLEAPPAAEIEKPSAYLFRTAHNLMLDLRRSEGRERRREGGVVEHQIALGGGVLSADQPSPEQAASAREALRRLAAEISQLPAKPRLAFELHKLKGHSHAETARLMGISRSGVEKHMMAALKLLTARLT